MQSASLKWGAIIGIASYLVLGIGVNWLGLAAFGNGPADLDTNPGKLTLGCTYIFALCFAFSVAGFFAARETGRVGTGTVAGLNAGVIYGVLIQIYAPGSEGLVARGVNPDNLLVEITAALTAILLYIGIAAVMGLLGARPGATRSPLLRRAATAPKPNEPTKEQAGS